MLSLGAAAVSFTHIVKAMEPFFSALVAAVAFRQVFKPQVREGPLKSSGGESDRLHIGVSSIFPSSWPARPLKKGIPTATHRPDPPLPFQVYASLIPVVLGVSVACAHDVSFSWPAFVTAMVRISSILRFGSVLF